MIDFKNPQEAAQLIDQTLLHPTASQEEVRRFCGEAAVLGFKAVCLAPCWVRLARNLMEKSEVRVCTVAGFPLGFESVALKVKAVQLALADGADEIDYVVNLGAVKGEDRNLVAEEMAAIRRAAEQMVVKVILEMGYLSQEEKKWLCRLAVDTGIDFVKTSTGLGPTGAAVADVKLLSEWGRGQIGVKAAGGIRKLQDLQQMVQAGASRIGTSAGREIVGEAPH